MTKQKQRRKDVRGRNEVLPEKDAFTLIVFGGRTCRINSSSNSLRL